jgi:hypothetical protein
MIMSLLVILMFLPLTGPFLSYCGSYVLERSIQKIIIYIVATHLKEEDTQYLGRFKNHGSSNIICLYVITLCYYTRISELKAIVV